MFRNALAEVDYKNCDAVLAFTHLLVIYSFGIERQDERLFLVDKDQLDLMPSWLYFLRSGCSMLCTVWEYLESGPVADLASAWEIPIVVPEGGTTPLVDYLLSLIPLQSSEEAWPEEVCQSYRVSTIELWLAFQNTYSLGTSFTTWDCLRLWPMRIKVEYIKLLDEHHPSALILLAHYCLLLHKLESKWYFEGRAKRLLSTVLRFLDPKWWCYIQWPVQELGGSSALLAQVTS
jgi:hypothetical protein